MEIDFQTSIGAVAGTSPMCKHACGMIREMKKNISIFMVLVLTIAIMGAYKVKAASENDDMFEYEGSTYRVINEKKHRAQLVKSRPLTDYDGKCYEQEAYVYNDEIKYSVYSIGYKAFSEDGIKGTIEVRLPETVRELKSECMGVNIVKLDLSETKVKTIPSYLFVTYEGTKDITPVINEIILSKTCKKIAGYAFNKCDNIKKMTIPEKVTKIGCYAIGKTCGELIFEGKVPSGMVNQKMKKTVIWVKTDYYIDALELLIKPVSLGRCEVREVE